MTSLAKQEIIASRSATLWLGLALWLCAPLAVAQNNLGEVLDAGGELLSPEQFKQELVQRVLVGPTPAGLQLEIMYATNGMVQGVGAQPGSRLPSAAVNGEWKIDAGKICTTMTLTGPTFGVHGGGATGVMLPSRCQSWFKLGEKYFISDSDTDRRTKVLLRTVKQ